MDRYIAFDVETPNRFNSRMSAIGIAVVEDGRIVDSFYSLVVFTLPYVDLISSSFSFVSKTPATLPTSLSE